jgi:hypothetical protein
MVCTFIFHVIGACESILMSRFFVGARGARVPIIHVESASEAYILIRKLFDGVGESGVWRELHCCCAQLGRYGII